MFDDFQKKAKTKRRSAGLMLAVAVVIMIGGVILFFRQLDYVNQTISDSIKMLTASEKNNSLKKNVGQTSITDSSEYLLDKVDKKELINTLNTTNLLNMVSRTIFLIVTFFVVQIFLKLYKHNTNMADFYFSCCDAWKFNTEELTPKNKESFILLLKSLYPNEIKLDTPNSPDLSSFMISRK